MPSPIDLEYISPVFEDPHMRGASLLPETQAFADRVTANGGTIEDGALSGLYDPLIRELKAQGHYGDTAFIGAASAREVVSGSQRTWYDASGGAHDAIQATTSKRPTDTTNSTFGGKVVGNFDGSDDILVTESYTITQPATLLFVFQFDTVAASSNFVFVTGRESTNRFQLYNDGSKERLRIYNTSALDGTESHSGKINFSGVFNGSQSKVIVNGTTENTGDLGTADADGIAIGGYYPTQSNFVNAPIAALIAVEDELTLTEQGEIYSITDSYYA